MSLIRFIMMAAILSVTSMTVSAADPLKVAFVYSAPIGDGGWNFAHEKARREVQAKFGNKIKTMWAAGHLGCHSYKPRSVFGFQYLQGCSSP